MQYINPVDSYGVYPVNFPEKTTNLSSSNDILLALHTDTYNRLVHLKNKMTTAEANINTAQSDIDTAEAIIATQGSSISTLQGDLNTLDSEVGGIDFSGTYITDGMTHKAAIEAIDNQVGQNSTNIISHTSSINIYGQNITSLAGKLSTTALNNVVGFPWTDAAFLASGDKVENAVLKLDQVLIGLKRGNEFNYRQNLSNWLSINSTTIYSYDSFYDESKIYYSGIAPSSTAGCYNALRQDFGHNTTSWVFYSVMVPETTGLNRIKIKYNYTGTLVGYATLEGYSGSYTELTSQDTWITIPTGTELVIKFIGTPASYLYNFMVTLKTV